MSFETKRWDSIVVGAGLAGLMAGVRLQQAGHQVLLLDRREAPGGKCAVQELDGHLFTIGCNDFGSSMQGRLANVGVNVEFKPSTALLQLGSTQITSPPGLGSLLRLLPRIPGILRLVKAVKNRTHPTLGEILKHNVKSPAITDILGMVTYAIGVPVQDMTTESLAAAFSKTWNYGMDKFMIPVPNVQAITDGLVQRFTELGGTLQLGVTCQHVETLETHKVLHTSEGSMESTHLLTTQEREYSGRPGLSACQLLLAVPKNFPYIKQRSIIYMPSQPDVWLKALDNGDNPDDCGFNAFRDQEGSDSYTIVAYTLMPRGQEDPNPTLHKNKEEFLLDRLERYLPGLRNTLVYKKFFSPKEYEQQWGLTSELSLAIHSPEQSYPPMHDPETDVYYIGNGVDIPPGDHANSALLSGTIAAQKILEL